MQIHKYHNTLSHYFASKPHFFDGDAQKKPHIRKCSELPWQQTKAALKGNDDKLWDIITETLCNLYFIQAKACAKLTYDLVKDYHFALDGLPEYQPEKEKERKRQERLDKYTRDLIACAEGKISRFDLEVPECITPWTEEQIDAEIERIKKNPTRADKLRDFINFLGHEVDNLQSYADEISNLIFQLSWKWNKDGAVGFAANNYLKLQNRLLLKQNNDRSIYNPLPSTLKLYKRDSNISSVGITPDGKYVYLNDYKSFLVWDTKTSQLIKKIDGYKVYATTPDCKKGISGFDKNRCILLDLTSGKVIKFLEGHNDYITSACITSDGKKAISASKDKTCIIWNLDTGKPLHTLTGHTNTITSVSITADCKRAITASRDFSCILWNLENGEIIKRFAGTYLYFHSVSITPDGKKAIAGNENKNIIVFDLIKEQPVFELRGHSHFVFSVSISPDGQYALSSSWDTTIILWDLNTGKALKKLKGHTDAIYSVTISTDCRFAFSGSDDSTSILWDLNAKLSSQVTPNHIASICITENNKWAFSNSFNPGLLGKDDNECILWDLSKGTKHKYLKEHYSPVTAIAISPDGDKAISGHEGGVCILWDLKTGQVLLKHEAHYWGRVLSIAFSMDGQFAVSTSQDRTCVVWDIIFNKHLRRYKGHRSEVKKVFITANENIAITCSDDKTCQIWNLKTGQTIKTLELNSYVWNENIAANGKILICDIGDKDKTTVFIDLNTGCTIKKLKYYFFKILCPDGKAVFQNDYGTMLYDFNKMEICNFYKNSFFETISPDNSKAISYEKYGFSLWDLNTNKKIASYVENSNIAWIQFVNNGIFVVETKGESYILRSKDLLSFYKYPSITVKKVWNFYIDQYNIQKVRCPECNELFLPDSSMLKTIDKTNNRSNVSNHECFVPYEKEEHLGIFNKCPNCNAKLKFNPFIAGGED